MKKFIAGFVCFLIIGGLFIYSAYCFYDKDSIIYLNADDEKSYLKLSMLQKALKKEGKRVVLSDNKHFKSGKINLYATNNSEKLPKVLDTNEINFLWVSDFPDRWALEELREFDVVVAKNYPLFSHLKAVNVRTAFVPDIIDTKEDSHRQDNNGKVMYWGNAEGFSLALYLAGKYDFSVDVYGKGFEGVWPKEDILGDEPRNDDFSRYALVLVDQREEDIRDEIVNEKIIQVIEKGGLPFVRFNYGIFKMFGHAMPMYANPDDFYNIYQRLLSSPEKIKSWHDVLIKESQNWNSEMTAKKFIELFEIMQQKRI